MMDIVFYGERGLVNSIIADMGTDLEKHKKFLKAIKLTDGGKLNWTAEITNIPQYIIEPSFAEFGDPDLIVVATADGKRHVIFIEAKLSAYNDAASALSDVNNRLLDNYDGKASKVNVQLAFKYRFVQAYEKMIGNLEVVEDKLTAEKYNDKPRRLKKEKVVELCKRYFGNAEDFYFVALTNDNADIKPYQNKSYLPPIGTKWEGKDAKSKFGILSYEMLEKAGVVEKNCGYYKNPRLTMLGSPADTGISSKDERIYTLSMKYWTPKQRDDLEQFKNEIELQTTVEIEKYEGSYSIKVEGITVVKFFVSSKKDEKDKVYLVFRNDNLPEKFTKDPKIQKVLIGTADNVKSFAVIYKGTSKGILEWVDETVKFIDR